MSETFQLDNEEVPFTPGQTVLQAALTAGRYIPHLCYHPEFKPHGSCKVCTVKIGNRTAASCTMPAQAGLEVESDTEEMNDLRRTLHTFVAESIDRFIIGDLSLDTQWDAYVAQLNQIGLPRLLKIMEASQVVKK